MGRTIVGSVLLALSLVAPAVGQPRPGGSLCGNKNIEPDADFAQWPVVRDIGAPNLRYGLQVITRARRCTEEGDWERAANLYVEAQGLLAPALPLEKQIGLLTRATDLRWAAAYRFYKAGNRTEQRLAMHGADSALGLLTQLDPNNAEWPFKLFAVHGSSMSVSILQEAAGHLRRCIQTTQGPEIYRQKARELLPQLEAQIRERNRQIIENLSNMAPITVFEHRGPYLSALDRFLNGQATEEDKRRYGNAGGASH
jgi:hypothetical protein